MYYTAIPTPKFIQDIEYYEKKKIKIYLQRKNWLI